MNTFTKVALSITGIALVATLVVNGNGTANVIQAAGKAFGGSISAAEKG